MKSRYCRLQETVWISRALTEGGVQNILTILPVIVIPSIMAKHAQVSTLQCD